MGTYLNSITPYTLYKSECLSAYFVDKTLMLRELFPYVSAGNRHICITAVYGIQRSPFCFRTAVFRSQRPPIC